MRVDEDAAWKGGRASRGDKHGGFGRGECNSAPVRNAPIDIGGSIKSRMGICARYLRVIASIDESRPSLLSRSPNDGDGPIPRKRNAGGHF